MGYQYVSEGNRSAEFFKKILLQTARIQEQTWSKLSSEQKIVGNITL